MKKYKRKELPENHTKEDFKCFGPVAEKDGEFENNYITELGYFSQADIDSNKYYHSCVTQSIKTNRWFLYVEFGRTGSGNCDFQFFEFETKEQAHKEYCKKLHSKNDKRGQWIDDPILGRVLRSKPGKDCYLVRNLAQRTTGLPNSRNITNFAKSKEKKSKVSVDDGVYSLLKDLRLGTIDYATSSFGGSNIPSPDSINKGRLILEEALKTKGHKRLEELSEILYSLIPKKKNKKDIWILSSDNIKSWQDDLDAFESAYNSMSVDENEVDVNLNFSLSHLKESEVEWRAVEFFINKSTLNKHSYIPGKMKIKNIWRLSCNKKIEDIDVKISNDEKPSNSIYSEELDKFKNRERKTTWNLFHASRSVNIGGILSTDIKLPKQLSGVTINGAMFGSAFYTSDDWKKSAGYASLKNSYWARGSGEVKNREAFMFISNTVLGKPKIEHYAKGYSSPPNGYNSVYGKAGKSLQNNEYIVYNTNQHKLEYLIEFTT